MLWMHSFGRLRRRARWTARALPALLIACSGDDVAPADSAPADSEALADPLLQFEGDRPQNLLMITIDTLRRDYVGRYGGPETPFLDELLTQGVALDRHQANSNFTAATVLSAMTGQYTTDLGFHPADFSAFAGDIEAAHDMLAARGYSTYLVPANSVYESFPTAYQQIDKEMIGAADTVVAAGLGFELEPPWFLHLHFMDPHVPYNPPPEYLTGLDDLEPFPYDLGTTPGMLEAAGSWNELDEATQALMLQHVDVRYAGAARYLDDQLALLWAELEARGDLDDALVSVWSDHGESFGEADLWTHGQTLRQPEAAALAAFWAPNLTPAAWDDLTCHPDLLPTIFEALALDPPDAFTGRVLGRDAGRSCHGIAMGEALGVQQSLVSGDHKLYYLWSGQIALLDLSADPDELVDVKSDAPETAAALWEEMAPEVERLQVLFPDIPANPPEL